MRAAWGPFPDCDISLIAQLCPWYVDMICRLMNKLPKRVMVMDGHESITGRRQSQSQALFDFGGIPAQLSANVTAAVEQDETTVRVQGSKGELLLDYFSGEIKCRNLDARSWVEMLEPCQQPVAGWPGIHESIKAFFDAWYAGQDTLNNPERLGLMCAIGSAAELSKDSADWADINY